MRHALDSKESRDGEWRRKFSSATYAKVLIEEVAPPNAEVQETVSILDDGLDDSFRSSVEEAGAPEQAQPVAQAQAERPLTRELLKGKIQAGVQKMVDDFWGIFIEANQLILDILL